MAEEHHPKEINVQRKKSIVVNALFNQLYDELIGEGEGGDRAFPISAPVDLPESQSGQVTATKVEVTRVRKR
jgi:hypothetical protein